MADRIILTDDGAFFVKTLDVPEGLSDADVCGFVQTWVANASPMPSERMRVGYLRRGGSVAVFAALDARVFAGIDDGVLASARAVIAPTSVLLFAGIVDGVAVLRSPRSVACVRFESGKIADFFAQTLSADFDVSQVVAELKHSADSDGGERFFVLSKISDDSFAEISEVDAAAFSSGDMTGGKFVRIPVPKTALRTLDIRRADIVRNAVRKRRVAEAKSAAAKMLPLLFLVLLAFQIFVWAKAAKVSALALEVAELAPAAKSAETLGARIAELQTLSGGRISAVDSLALANFVRPDSVRFSRFSQESSRVFTVAGQAPSIGDAHAYLKLLRERPEISDAEIKTESARGVAKFTIKAVLK